MKAAPNRVVGFEGSLAATTKLSWGSVAIQTPTGVVNPRTGQICSVDEFHRLAAEGYIAAFEHPLPVPQSDTLPKAIACVFRVDAPEALAVRGDMSKPRGKLATRTTNGCHIVVFEDDAAFATFADDRATAIYRRELGELAANDPTATAAQLALLEAALVLAPNHPLLLALQTSLAKPDEQEFLEAVALAAVRTPEDRAQFEAARKRLSNAPACYELTFKGGVAHDGFGIRRTRRVLDALDVITSESSDGAVQEYLGNDPRNRAEPLALYARAASMSFNLAAPKFATLFERVSWMTRFEEVARWIAGEEPTALLENDKLAEAVAQLYADDLGDSLEYRLGSQPVRQVSKAPAGSPNVQRQTVEVVGYIAGMLDDGRSIQLRLPGRKALAKVSLDSNGAGDPPVGAMSIAKSSLFGAVAARLALEWSPALRIHLLEIQPLVGALQTRLTGSWSSVLSGRVAHGFSVPLAMTQSGLTTIDGKQLSSARPSTKDAAHRWFDEVSVALSALEAARLRASSSPLRYFPRVPFHAGLLGEIIGVLRPPQVPLTNRELWGAVQRLSPAPRRDNNIMKEIRTHNKLFVRDEGTVTLSEEGLTRALALGRVGAFKPT